MWPMEIGESAPSDWSRWLPVAVREVEDFLAESGWDQPPQLFALVPTAELVAAEPDLATQLPVVEGLTPVAQDALTGSDLAEALAGICWPDEVTGCALAQEIIVLPPAAEAELDRALTEDSPSADPNRPATNGAPPVSSADPGAHPEELSRVAVRLAQQHPDHRDARLVVAVLRAGAYCCLLRLRGTDGAADELVERPDLAPNMVAALLRTLDVEV